MRTKYVQWQHDLKLLLLREKLVKTGAVSQQVWVDTQNNEEKSRLEHSIAVEKIRVFFGLSHEEINPGLTNDAEKLAEFTLRAPVDGVVGRVNAVLDELYAPDDILVTIQHVIP